MGAFLDRGTDDKVYRIGGLSVSHKIDDITGKRFGKWTVLALSSKNKNGVLLWECRCDCGTVRAVPGTSLKNRHSKSCGCSTRGPRHSLVGHRYDNLTVVSQTALKNKSGSYLWQCRCDCGKTTLVSAHNLKHTKSCGCMTGKGRLRELGSIINGLEILEYTVLNSGNNNKALCRCTYCGAVKELNINWYLAKTKRGGVGCGCQKNGRFIISKNIPKELKAHYHSYVHKYANTKRAKDPKKQFCLTNQEFIDIVYSDCFYCGTKPNPYNGIDRVDSSKPYITENCVPCCTICNRMKIDLNVHDWLSHCNRIVANSRTIKRCLTKLGFKPQTKINGA